VKESVQSGSRTTLRELFSQLATVVWGKQSGAWLMNNERMKAHTADVNME